MQIGLVCPYDLGLPGGVQQVVLELASHLQGTGDDVLVVGPGTPELDPGVPFVSAGPTMRIRANKSVVPLSLRPSAWTRTLRAVSSSRLIHIHEPFMPLVGWAALSLRSFPTVATFHADPPGWARRAYAAAAFLGEFGLGGVITTAVSPVAAAAVPRRWGTPRLIPNGIDVASFAVDVPREDARVAFLGRDEPRKGLDILLESWPGIIEAHPDAELVVMGADRKSTHRGVTYLGRVGAREKTEVLASSSILVTPNTGGESFGLVVAEGMAAGCAVVASDLAAFASVLGDSGVLFPRGNSLRLTEQVNRLLSNPAEARRLGGAARERARRFDWSEVVNLYRDAYKEALR